MKNFALGQNVLVLEDANAETGVILRPIRLHTGEEVMSFGGGNGVYAADHRDLPTLTLGECFMVGGRWEQFYDYHEEEGLPMFRPAPRSMVG